MTDPTGFQINADLSPLTKSLKDGQDEFQRFDDRVNDTVETLRKLEDGSTVAVGSIADLTEQATKLRSEIETLDPSTQAFTDKVQALSGVQKQLTAVQQQATGATKNNTLATQAFGAALGYLGATSITSVVSQIVNLTRQSIDLAISFAGVQARAEAIYGAAFPQVTAEADKLATSMGRSKEAVLDFMTGFGAILDGLDIAPDRVRSMSTELTQLTINLSKAFPDKSDADVFQIIQSGIEGNVRGLRQLGIVMTNKRLQDLADTEGIKTKVAHMTDEQLSMLRTQFLLTETQKLQEAGVLNTQRGTDATKEFQATWQDFAKTLGTFVLPAFNSFLSAMGGGLKATILLATQLRDALFDAVTFGNYAEQYKAVEQGAATANDNASYQQAHGIGLGAARKTLMPGEYDKPAPFDWSDQNPGSSSSSNKAAEAAKKADEAATKTHDDEMKRIQETQDAKAAVEKDEIKFRTDELTMRKAINGLTDEEQKELDKISGSGFDIANAHNFKDLLAGMNTDTDTLQSEFDKVTTTIKTATDALTAMGDASKKQVADLETQLADIDEQSAKKTQDRTAQEAQDLAKAYIDAQKTVQDFNTQSNQGKVMQSSDVASFDQANAAIAQVQGLLQKGGSFADQIRASVASQNTFNAANPAQQAILSANADTLKTTQDATAQKATINNSIALEKAFQAGKLADYLKTNDAILTADQKAHAQDLLDQKAKLDDELKLNQDLQQQITDAMTAQISVREKAAQAYADAEIAHFRDIRQAALDAAAAVAGVRSTSAAVAAATGHAGGGPVYGPGGPTSDSINARLSNGEHVFTAREVNLMGGQAAVSQFRQMLNSGSLRVPFARGGPVSKSYHDNHSSQVTVNAYGDAARAVVHPAILRWQLRKHS